MSLIPVGVRFTHTMKPYNSADAPLFVAGDDGQDYVAKRPSPGNPCLAVSEAIAYWLSARLGLAVPSSAWLKFEDGSVAFGSRWEIGVTQFGNMSADQRQQAFTSCREQIARFCLLDAFLANPDRHADNLLFRTSPLDGRWTVISMDFSRALWRGGFPRTTPGDVVRVGNTAGMVTMLKTLGAFNATINGALVAGLQSITAEQIGQLLSDMPPNAICDEARRLPDWWATQTRLDRAAALLVL